MYKFDDREFIAFLLNKTLLFRKSICKEWFYQNEDGAIDKLLVQLSEQERQLWREEWQKKEENAKHLQTLYDSGFRIVVFGGKDYPPLLQHIHQPPILLWARGNIALLNSLQIAIVGSRSATRTGIKSAEQLARQLSAKQITITSGLALGIDSASHRGALSATGKTIAVIGSGFKKPYPKSNIKLMRQIVENNGLILSEYYLDQQPLPYHFLERNRIISGMSLGTVIIEASEKSGSLTTARRALEQNRSVFAVPNHFLNRNSAGCNQLLREGAVLTTCAEDVIHELLPEIYNYYKEHNIDKATLLESDEIPTPNNHFSDTQKLIVSHLSFEPVTIDVLAELCQLDIATLARNLTELELTAVVSKNDIGYFKL